MLLSVGIARKEGVFVAVGAVFPNWDSVEAIATMQMQIVSDTRKIEGDYTDTSFFLTTRLYDAAISKDYDIKFILLGKQTDLSDRGVGCGLGVRFKEYFKNTQNPPILVGINAKCAPRHIDNKEFIVVQRAENTLPVFVTTPNSLDLPSLHDKVMAMRGSTRKPIISKIPTELALDMLYGRFRNRS